MCRAGSAGAAHERSKQPYRALHTHEQYLEQVAYHLQSYGEEKLATYRQWRVVLGTFAP